MESISSARLTTQNQKILAYLRTGKSFTRLEGLALFGSLASNSRVADLRKLGVPIVTRMIEVETATGGRAKVAEYSLPTEASDGSLR